MPAVGAPDPVTSEVPTPYESTGSARRAAIAGVDANPTQLGTGNGDSRFHTLGDVVGIDEQRGGYAECRDLTAECRCLVRTVFGGVQESEGVRTGTCAGYVVTPRGFEVGGGVEAGEIRGT
jgi:hypothetical protein